MITNTIGITIGIYNIYVLLGYTCILLLGYTCILLLGYTCILFQAAEINRKNPMLL